MDIKLAGRIDSDNAAAVEKQIFSQLADGKEARLDASDLTYISSAGLRVLLRVSKAHPDMRIVNVGSDVYEILEMTGFIRRSRSTAARRSDAARTARSTASTRTPSSRSTETRMRCRRFRTSGKWRSLR